MTSKSIKLDDSDDLVTSFIVVSDWSGVVDLKKSDKLEDLSHNAGFPNWKPANDHDPNAGSFRLSTKLSAKNEGRYTGTITASFLYGLPDCTVGGLSDELGW